MMQENTHHRRALVVEDEPVISRICQKTLALEGFDVDIAMNGLVAKDMVNHKTYDVCLSDIRTPAMNGIELYEYLEKVYPELARKVIFTTGDVLSEAVARFLKKNKNPFLPKPFTPEQLRQKIKNFIVDNCIY